MFVLLPVNSTAESIEMGASWGPGMEENDRKWMKETKILAIKKASNYANRGARRKHSLLTFMMVEGSVPFFGVLFPLTLHQVSRIVQHRRNRWTQKDAAQYWLWHDVTVSEQINQNDDGTRCWVVWVVFPSVSECLCAFSNAVKLTGGVEPTWTAPKNARWRWIMSPSGKPVSWKWPLIQVWPKVCSLVLGELIFYYLKGGDLWGTKPRWSIQMKVFKLSFLSKKY